MQFLGLAALIGVLAAGPIFGKADRDTHANCGMDNHALTVSNFTVFSAEKGKNCSSYIQFNIQDTNQYVELNTACSRTVKPTSTDSISDGQYYACSNSSVLFVWDDKNLRITHDFKDECLGSSPYDGMSAYGQSNTTFKIMKVSDGVYKTKTRFEVPITSLAA